MSAALALAFGAVFLAELGDKSQLLSVAFATRRRAVPVLAGIAVASAVVTGASAAVGSALERTVPADVASIAAGVLFLLFAVHAVVRRGDGEAGEAHAGGDRSAAATVATVATAFAVAELGDKTMFTVVALAARGQPFATWAGATLGMVSANVAAVVVGRWLGGRLPAPALAVGSAVVFAGFGIALVVTGLLAVG